MFFWFVVSDEPIILIQPRSRNTEPKGDFWQVVSGARFCEIVDGGRCVSDGEGSYGNRETCTVKALRPLVLTTEQYAVESGYDYLSVNGRAFGGNSGPEGMKLDAGAQLVWRSDGSRAYDGFKVCASADAETNGGLVVVVGLLG